MLAQVKSGENRKRIQVLVFTASSSEKDIPEVYDLRASAFITETLDFDDFTAVVESLEEFWFTIIKFPKDASSETNY